jgi:tetratricopeptide (TPR) repeat protein
MKNIFLIISTILLSLEIFSIRSLAVVSRSRSYPQLINQTHITQAQNSSQDYFEQGNAKSALGNKQEAIIDYDRAISLNPKFTKAYFSRGRAKFDIGNKQEAITDFDRVIELNPEYAQAYGTRSIAKYQVGNKQEAISDIVKAAELFRQQGRIDLHQKSIEMLRKFQKN